MHFRLLAICLAAWTSGINAQSFTSSLDATAKNIPFASAGEIAFYDTVTNTGADTLRATFTISHERMPAEWSTYLCVNVCFPPSRMSIPLTIPPGQSTIVQVHVLTSDIQDSAFVQVSLSDNAAPEQPQTVLLRATTLPNSAVLARHTPISGHTLSRIGHNRINLQLPRPGQVELSVQDLSGRMVQRLCAQHLEAGTHFFGFDTRALGSATYLVVLRGSHHHTTLLPLTVIR